jgi:hypothetical protein
MSHTPGPWHIHWGDKYPYIKASNGDYVLDHNGKAGYVRREDDARLIAASPGLLQALKSIALMVTSREADGYGPPEAVLIANIALAAIAKAGDV